MKIQVEGSNCIPPKRYSVSFKKFIVERIEKGEINKEQARRQYHIGGKTTVLKWCRKYGNLQRLGLKNEVTMVTEDNKLQVQNRRISMLEKALEDAQLKNTALETMIDIAEKEFGIPIRKKPGAKQSKQSVQATQKSR